MQQPSSTDSDAQLSHAEKHQIQHEANLAFLATHETFEKIASAGTRVHFWEYHGAAHVQRNLHIHPESYNYIQSYNGPPPHSMFFEGTAHIPQHPLLAMMAPNIHYDLGVERRGLRDYPQLMPFVIAHEIKHATLIHSRMLGKPNIKTSQKVAERLPALLPLCALSLYEENLCDDFALRVYPDVSLDAFEDHLKTTPDREPISRLFSTHPPDDVRVARLRRKQRALLASL
jgi:hypothetical protein